VTPPPRADSPNAATVGAAAPSERADNARRLRRLAGRNAALVGMPALLVAALLFTVLIHPQFGSFDVQSLALGALPLAMAAAAQAIVVISGGIDLSVGSLMAVSNVLAASAMQHASFRQSLILAALILAAGAVQGLANGIIVVVSRIPDVVVTLTTGFIWGGVALLILEKPGGGAPPEFLDLAAGSALSPWLPNALLLLIVAVGVVWLPVIRSRLGLLIYAVGSDRIAAFRSGVNVQSTRILAYVVAGLFSALGGLALTMTTGIGAPLAGTYYTLSSVAAIVIGGVRLTGGRGGVVGPVIAALLLTLIPTDLIFLNIDPNYGQVIQGTLIVFVVMIGGFVSVLQSRK
jgi:ribose transport system permease protein